MKSLFIKFVAALVIMTGALAMFQGTAKAATHGIYTVTATPYYAHPLTGLVEDSGKNPGIGQGMTESVLNEKALLEVNENGDHFVTVRFFLMDNIEDMKLDVQKDAQSDFESVDYTVMKEAMEDATADLRFEIPDENAIVRAKFYVVPMGRDVVFYMTFGDLVEGAGDFVTSIKVDESIAAYQKAENTQTSKPAFTAAASAKVTAAIDVNGGLTVYENNNNANDQDGGTFNQFIIIAIAIVAAIGLTGFIYYKKKVNKITRKDGSKRS